MKIYTVAFKIQDRTVYAEVFAPNRTHALTVARRDQDSHGGKNFRVTAVTTKATVIRWLPREGGTT